MKSLHLLAQLIDGGDVDIPKPPLTSTSITNGLQVVFGIAAALTVLFIAISALKIVLSRGNSQEVVKQRDSIIYAAIGLTVTLTAFLIVTFVVERA
jgi:hypothetical protein